MESIPLGACSLLRQEIQREGCRDIEETGGGYVLMIHCSVGVFDTDFAGYIMYPYVSLKQRSGRSRQERDSNIIFIE